VKKIFLLLSFVVCLIVLSLFSNGVPKLGADDRYPLHPIFRLFSYSDVWSHYVKMLGGTAPLRIATLFPSVTILSFLELIGTSILDRQKIEYILLYLTGSLGTCFLVYTLTRKKWASFFSGLLYVFNPYFLFSILVSREQTYLWATYPLLTAVFIRGIQTKKSSYALLFGLVFLWGASGALNFPILALVFMTCFLFSLYFLFISNDRISLAYLYKFSILCLVVYFLFNAWWIFPFLPYFSRVNEEFANTFVPLVYVKEDSELTSFLAVSRLFRSVDSPRFSGSFFFNSFNVFNNMASFVLPLLIMGVSLIAKENRKLIRFLSLFVLLFLFLSKGSHEPFGKIYEWLIVNIPFFSIFRHPLNKFGMPLSLGYAILFGIGLDQFLRWFKTSSNFFSLLILSFLASPLVFFYQKTGNRTSELFYGNFLIWLYIFIFGIEFGKWLKKSSKYSISKLLFIIFFVVFTGWLAYSRSFFLGRSVFSVTSIVIIFALGIITRQVINFLFKDNTFKFQSLMFLVAFFPLVFVNLTPYVNRVFLLTGPLDAIPDYYYEAEDWLAKQKENFRLFSLPSNAQIVALKWPGKGGGFRGYDFAVDLFKRPVVDFLAGELSDEPIRFQSLKPLRQKQLRLVYPETGFDYQVADILRLMNIKYLLLHKDNNWELFGTSTPDETKDKILQQKGLSLAKTFGELEFYEVKSFLPHVYFADRAIIVSGHLESVFSNLANTGFLEDKPVLFITDQMPSGQISRVIDLVPEVILNNSSAGDLAIDLLRSSYSYRMAKNNYIRPKGNQAYEIWMRSLNLQLTGNAAFSKLTGGKKVDEYFIDEYFVKNQPDSILSERWTKIKDVTFEPNQNISFTSLDYGLDRRFGEMVIVPKSERVKKTDFIIEKIQNQTLSPSMVFSRMRLEGEKGWNYEPVLERKFTIHDEKDFFVTEDNIKFLTINGKYVNGKIKLREGNYILKAFLYDSKKSAFVTLSPFAEFSPNEVPGISFLYRRPSFYSGEIEGPGHWLVFSEAYNDKWDFVVKNKQIKDHFLVNGYANAWYISETEAAPFKIVFSPQKYFYFGLIVSSLSIILLISVVILRRKARK